MNANEILQRFVASADEIRFYMQKPFKREGFIYATNGCVAIRVPECEGIDAEEHDHLPSIRDLFENNIRDSFINLPSLPEVEMCKVCDGSGVLYTCPSCDGDGEFEHHGWMYDCKECDCLGQVSNGSEEDKEPCFRCDGTGHAQQLVKVENTGFDRRYLAKIIDLPGFKFAINPEPTGVAYFIFDGGEGLLMPMRV